MDVGSEVVKVLSRNGLAGTDLARASKERLSGVEVGWNLLTFETENFVHLCWELMAKFDESVGISVSDFISQVAHHCIDVGWSWISVNSLRQDCLHALDESEIIPLCAEK